ncbi:MAG TPA: hypothetical protein ENI87_01375 [bacterium]|nr:hypothetical protein [bacterium]
MNWHAVVLAPCCCGLLFAQTPPAPAGSVKSGGSAGKQQTARIRERAASMRESIVRGRQVKSHVKVVVRLKNGNKLTGVVKDGRLVERVDGLRFVDAQAREPGAGIRLWYTGGTRSYIFVPFESLKTYEVVQRLSARQLLEIEKEMQMAEARAAERARRAAQKAKGKAEGDVQKALQPGQLQPGQLQPGQLQPGQLPPGQLPPAESTGAGKAETAETTKASPAKVESDGAADVEQMKRELLWSELLRKYPPKLGWNEAKKNEIARRLNVVGAVPSDAELYFVEHFDDWIQACEHNGIDPNAATEQKPQTKRERRKAERERMRGR